MGEIQFNSQTFCIFPGFVNLCAVSPSGEPDDDLPESLNELLARALGQAGKYVN